MVPAGEKNETQGVRRPDAGIGVAEVLIALVIFSTALLGVVGTAARVGGIINSSHVRLQAGAIAREQIEELLTEPYDSLKNGSATREGVQISWTIQENSRAKEMLVVYRYNVPSQIREDTLTAALIKPL